jgi:DNA-binding MarR family transcriptional regulator
MAVVEKAPEAPEALATNLSWLLAQASHGLAVELAAGLEKLGIGPRDYCVLSTALSGDHTQTELAQAVGVDKTTMVVTIDALEQAGLAERRPSETDRRAHVIGVTKAGARTVAKAVLVVDRIQRGALAALPAAQRDALLEGLATLICGPLSTQSPCKRPPRKRAPH